MNIVDTGRGLIVTNVFRVRPENQATLVDTIRHGGDPAVPGLVSMNLLRSEDGTQVINQMYWESRQAFEEAVSHNTEIAATMEAVGRLIEGAGPMRHEIVPVT